MAARDRPKWAKNRRQTLEAEKGFLAEVAWNGADVRIGPDVASFQPQDGQKVRVAASRGDQFRFPTLFNGYRIVQVF